MEALAKNYDKIIFVEDGVARGGISEYLQNVLLSEGITNTTSKAFPDTFLPHGTREEILDAAGLSFENIAVGKDDL